MFEPSCSHTGAPETCHVEPGTRQLLGQQRSRGQRQMWLGGAAGCGHAGLGLSPTHTSMDGGKAMGPVSKLHRAAPCGQYFAATCLVVSPGSRSCAALPLAQPSLSSPTPWATSTEGSSLGAEDLPEAVSAFQGPNPGLCPTSLSRASRTVLRGR